ncbi:hypothetical protein EVAR_24949_1 [Eumeta japonica]|uniref:Uncharacterized protein n=1 Tax=Eumeta variegata TaxID=151549 RepID=A0A4C1ZXM5_EUMVA|nr:hypothetical protein EVAR_24949_1 [Eumeta japonica]
MPRYLSLAAGGGRKGTKRRQNTCRGKRSVRSLWHLPSDRNVCSVARPPSSAAAQAIRSHSGITVSNKAAFTPFKYGTLSRVCQVRVGSEIEFPDMQCLASGVSDTNSGFSVAGTATTHFEGMRRASGRTSPSSGSTMIDVLSGRWPMDKPGIGGIAGKLLQASRIVGSGQQPHARRDRRQPSGETPWALDSVVAGDSNGRRNT